MIRLTTLGSVSLRAASGEELDRILSQPRQLGLLAYLLSSSDGGYIQRETLMGMFWPESLEERARASLRQAIHHLRQDLGSQAIITRGDSHVRFNEELLWCDFRTFEQVVKDGDQKTAVALYGGPFLSGFYLRSAPEFERWAGAKRRRIERQYETALEDLARAAEADGDLRAAVDWWDRLVEYDRCNTRCVLGLMNALIRYGDPGGALQAASGYEAAVRRDLNVAPDDAVLSLARRVQSSQSNDNENRQK